jgi:hypothetical protein
LSILALLIALPKKNGWEISPLSILHFFNFFFGSAIKRAKMLKPSILQINQINVIIFHQGYNLANISNSFKKRLNHWRIGYLQFSINLQFIWNTKVQKKSKKQNKENYNNNNNKHRNKNKFHIIRNYSNFKYYALFVYNFIMSSKFIHIYWKNYYPKGWMRHSRESTVSRAFITGIRLIYPRVCGK